MTACPPGGGSACTFIAGEEFIVEVKTVLNETMRDKHLQIITTETGTAFEVEYSLPPSGPVPSPVFA